MKKLNQTIYKKLSAQAEEAQRKGLVKLASNIKKAIEEQSSDAAEYTYQQLVEDIQRDLWVSAARVIGYYNVNSADAEKIHTTIAQATDQIIEDLEDTLVVKTPGENK